MIRRLHLERFGKFTGVDFDFSPVTLFFGENEAGKTTLFDALFDCLCRPRGITKNGKRLAARYGSDRSAAVEFEGEEFHPGEADFLNLFAVRSGDITLEVETNSRWMNNVKASLFSGGIDPQSAADRLDDMIRSRARNSLNAEAAALREETQRTRRELEEALTAREECIAGERRMEDRQREMNALAGDAALLETECGELEGVLEQQRLIAERRRCREVLSDIAVERRGAEELEALSRYSSAELADLEGRAEELRNLEAAAERAESAEKETARRIEELAARGGDREREKNRLERIRIAAGMFRGELIPREKFVRRRRETFLRKTPLIPASVLALAGVVALLFPDLPYRFFIAGGLLFLALAFLIASFGRRTLEDPSALDEALGRIRAGWRQETGEELPGSLDETLAALDRAVERSAFAASELEKEALLLRELETGAVNLEGRRKEAERNRAAAAEAFRASLDGAAAADLSDYARKLGHRQSLEKQRQELGERLSSRMALFHAASLHDLEELLREKIRDADGRITGEELSAEALRARENLFRDRKAALEALRRREKEWIGSQSENRGALRERFRRLPETIARCEAALARGGERREGIGRELRACEIARDIYRSLTGDADLTLRELSREIGETFSLFTGGAGAGGRPVDLKSWSPETARITDAGGTYREGDQLSAGTRDAFILASRLVLARKSLGGEEQALIVLDEPFIALDRTRCVRALGVLEEFHRSSLWQLVFFTKDGEMKARAREIFGPLLLIHDLEV